MSITGQGGAGVEKGVESGRRGVLIVRDGLSDQM